MTEFKYCVYCEEEPAICFESEAEAMKFAREDTSMYNNVRVEKSEVDEDGDILNTEVLWTASGRDEPEEKEVVSDNEFETDFPESDINKFNSIDDVDYAEIAKQYEEDPYGSDEFDGHEDLHIKEAVDALEENENEVECKCCFELFPKEDCIKTEKGYLCQKCNQELHSHQGTNLDLIDKDPFSLDYEDPRDPEEEKEPEVKGEPLDANEVRKHEAGIEENLEEHINDRPADIESDQELQGNNNAVVDCEVAKVIAHSEDEKPLDCKMEKPALEEPLAGEEVDAKLYEGALNEGPLNFAKNVLANKTLNKTYKNFIANGYTKSDSTKVDKTKTFNNLQDAENWAKAYSEHPNNLEAWVYGDEVKKENVLTGWADGKRKWDTRQETTKEINAINKSEKDLKKASQKALDAEPEKSITPPEDNKVSADNEKVANDTKNNLSKVARGAVFKVNKDFTAIINEKHEETNITAGTIITTLGWNNYQELHELVFYLGADKLTKDTRIMIISRDTAKKEIANWEYIKTIDVDKKSAEGSGESSGNKLKIDDARAALKKAYPNNDKQIRIVAAMLKHAGLVEDLETELSDEEVKELDKEVETLKEELKVIVDFSDYKPWSGAVDTYELIRDADKLDELEAYLEECYPDGVTATQINDILWFDGDQVLSYLGLGDAEDEEFDESLQEAKKENTLLNILGEDEIRKIGKDSLGIDDEETSAEEIAKNILDFCKDNKYDLEKFIITIDPEYRAKVCEITGDKIIYQVEGSGDNLKDFLAPLINLYMPGYKLELSNRQTGNEFITEELVEAKKDEEELPVDPEAVKLEVHQELNNLVADEIEAINGYDEAKADILDAPIEHKDAIIDTIDHIKDEEKEHIDELIDATTEIPFDKGHEAPAPVVEEPAPVAEPIVEPKIPADEPVVEENLNEAINLPDMPDFEGGEDIDGYITMDIGDGSDSIRYVGYDEDAAREAVDECYPDWTELGLGGGDTAPGVLRFTMFEEKDFNAFNSLVKRFEANEELSGTDLQQFGYEYYHDLDTINCPFDLIYQGATEADWPDYEEDEEDEEEIDEDKAEFQKELEEVSFYNIGVDDRTDPEANEDTWLEDPRMQYAENIKVKDALKEILDYINKLTPAEKKCLILDWYWGEGWDSEEGGPIVSRGSGNHFKQLWDNNWPYMEYQIRKALNDWNGWEDEDFEESLNECSKLKLENKDPLNHDFPEIEEGFYDEPFDQDVKEGDKIRIIHLEGEDNSYDGKEGTIEHIDSLGQLHGTWGGLAVIPGVDDFDIITEESLKEAKAKPEADKEKTYNDGLKLAKLHNKPVIYGYENKSYDGKFFALDDPIICNNVSDETKKFKQQYKSCGVVYVAYPDKDFAESLKESMKLSEYWWEDNDPMNQIDQEEDVECGWCHVFYLESECKYEQDFGYLCPQCVDALKSRGEQLVFVEPAPKDECLKETKETI